MSMELARGRAAQAWCMPGTEGVAMIPELAEAFAVILNGVWSGPWLGNATTGELLDELKARCEVNGTLDYKTIQGA